MKNKRVLEIFKIKLEVALAYMIIKDPFVELEHGLEEIGCLNEAAISQDATQFLETDLPFFVSNDIEEGERLHKHQYITFQQMQDYNIHHLAKKLYKMMES